MTYAQQSTIDNTGDELEAFVAEMSAVLQANNGLDVYKKDSFHGKLVLFDFRSHLYAPLICLEKSNLKIQLSPVALNTDEMRFVDYLKAYVDNHAAELVDKSLYLLRNKSKVGMGFFEAGNFYPDYILWIDTPETQYISFIDPKGLMHIRPDDPKIEFYNDQGFRNALVPHSGRKANRAQFVHHGGHPLVGFAHVVVYAGGRCRSCVQRS